MKDYREELNKQNNIALDMLYNELNPVPTQFLLDRIDDHDCKLDTKGFCECVAYVRELNRRMKKESEIL